MSNRILKQSICTSDTVDELSWFEEVVFYRLIVNCDDYGRMDARLRILKSALFPLKERLTVKELERALYKLADAGCVKLYKVGGKPYLYLPTWEVHQTIRAQKSRYPAPESGTEIKVDMNESENKRNQMIADECRCSRNPIQSNTIQSEYESESNFMPGAETPDSNPFIKLPLNNKTEFAVSEKMILEWAELYQAVDIKQELRKMKGWLDSNPSKKKTKSGIKRFINNWLSRAQDSGGSRKEISDQTSFGHDLDEYKSLVNSFGD